MRLHAIINSVVIAIVAIACLMNSFNIKSIVNVIEMQNKVMANIVNMNQPVDKGREKTDG